jgi:hypothetical protein
MFSETVEAFNSKVIKNGISNSKCKECKVLGTLPGV